MLSPKTKADAKCEKVLQCVHGLGSDVRLSAVASKILTGAQCEIRKGLQEWNDSM